MASALSARARARRVRLVVTDVDGVLTDGRMILSERGDELKAFHTRDGVAVALLRLAGVKTAMVTGETTPIAKARGDKLGVDVVVLGARRKGDTLGEICAQLDVPLAATAYVGDDLLDVPALQRAGLAMTVADAPEEVKRVAHVVTRAAAGCAVLRECTTFILRAQGRWRTTIEAYVRAHGGHPLA